MIRQESITKEWIETVAKSGKIDKILVEKVIRALILLEMLYCENKCCVEDILNDIIETALSVCLRQSFGKTDFNILSKGIIQSKPFIFSESFHLEKAITHAAKAVYIASVIKYKLKQFHRFNPKIDMKNWTITKPMNTKLNKIKKSDPEAFFYLYLVSEMEYLQ